MVKEKLTVNGMTCAHCEKRVQDALLGIGGVEKCKAKAKKNEVTVQFDETKTNLEVIYDAIEKAGYHVG